MAERIGQYYFEINSGGLVNINNGKMIEFDQRGHDRWPSWKSIGWGGAVIGTPLIVGYVGMGASWKLAEYIASKMDTISIIGKEATNWGTAGLMAVGAVMGMGATLMLMEEISDRIKRNSSKFSFAS